jgi:hypothetical protein
MSAPLVAQADSATTFHVNDTVPSACSDSTTDSSVTPYCTIQAAVNAATAPGDTVLITPGSYTPFTVTASGTAAAPITITSGVANYRTAPLTINEANGSAPVTVDGASYVTLHGFALTGTQTDLAVTGSASHVTVDGNGIFQDGTTATAPDVVIGAGTSAITLSRDAIDAIPTDAAAVSVTGSSDDVITTDEIEGGGPGVLLSGTTGSDITSNTLVGSCGAEAEAANGSTGASIENNLMDNLVPAAIGCGVPDAQAGLLVVDPSSVSGTTADYNDAYLSATAAATISIYRWAGTGYATASAFTAAVPGQAVHDDNTYSATMTVDSANSAAPGELSTDYLGNPRVDDPAVPNTGAGSVTYYDRGAVEKQDPIAIAKSSTWPTAMPLATPGTFAATVSDGWAGASIASCTYEFGDGSAAVTVTPSGGTCSTQHSYTVKGTYTVQLTVAAADGAAASVTGTVGAAGTNVLEPQVSVQAYDSREAEISDSGTHAWNLVSCDIDFGDGSSQTLTNGSCYADHTYVSSGTYPITITEKDSGGNEASATGSFTATGSLFNPTAPTRVLDTRKAIGVPGTTPVAAGGVVQLQLAGTNGIPADATAVALNVTATDTAGTGYVTVYPDGTSAPTASNLNFSAGETVPNVVLVKLGADGAIDLKNASTGTADLAADLEGYYAPTGDSYAVGTSARLLDTRTSHQTLAPGATLRVDMNAPSIDTAATLNVTATNETSAGYVTAFPDGTDAPIASNLNFTAKQTVANEVVVEIGADGYVDFKNSSPGTVDLVVDYNGDFETSSAGLAFTPIAPTRYLDTRKDFGDFTAADPLLADGALPAFDSVALSIAGAANIAGVPANAVAAAMNITVTDPTAGGYVTAYPSEQTQLPTASTLNYSPGQTIANAASILMNASGGGGINLYNGSGGSVQLVVDVFGYYS